MNGKVRQHALLFVKVDRGGVIRELNRHRPHDGDTSLVGDDRLRVIEMRRQLNVLRGNIWIRSRSSTHLTIDVGHQTHLDLHHLAADLSRLFSVGPRDSVGSRAVQSGVRGEDTECEPSLEKGGGWMTLKSTDVMRPESKAGRGQTETATEGFCHGFVSRFAVSTPLHKTKKTGC